MTYEGQYNILQQTQRFNQAHGMGLKKLLSRQPRNIWVFFDLFELGRDVADEWGIDGVHKRPKWYSTIIKYFFSVFCNGNM